ncbi:MAG: tetratricopeptide repeat protein, partial [Bacteroidetes bacterium]|nr:tetratricopeptide repeat protein [Bacteroidota bacterium]
AKNEFPQALEKYEEALKIYRELAKENPRTYLPDVAMTLNNLAVLQKAKNEFPQALEKYEEALKIYRELAKENPRTYLPDVAMTLNNLANLHSDKNEFPQALEKYEEALKIRRELAKENPRRYEIEYAKLLLMGVVLLNKDSYDLIKSKEILVRYKGIPLADKLLNMVNEIENKE